MADEYNLTLRQIEGTRGELYAIADELETAKMMLRRLPSRGYFSRTLWMIAAPIWALVGAVVLLSMR
jgi:hypothetical protein